MKNGVLSLSIETLPEYDADFLFVSKEFKRHSENSNLLSFLKQPIWSTLKAARNKQVYVGQWGGVGGPITANQFFDDLYEHFVNSP
jgi:iron complex transport system substrate-binding protein